MIHLAYYSWEPSLKYKCMVGGCFERIFNQKRETNICLVIQRSTKINDQCISSILYCTTRSLYTYDLERLQTVSSHFFFNSTYIIIGFTSFQNTMNRLHRMTDRRNRTWKYSENVRRNSSCQIERLKVRRSNAVYREHCFSCLGKVVLTVIQQDDVNALERMESMVDNLVHVLVKHTN